MPIDIKSLRADSGGDPDFWRENQRRRFCDPGLVDVVLGFDTVSGVRPVAPVALAAPPLTFPDRNGGQ